MIIFDEAHNIEQQCEDAASVMISSMDLAGCLEDITKVMQWMVDSKSSTPSLAISADDNEENNVDPNGNFSISADQYASMVNVYFSSNGDTGSNL